MMSPKIPQASHKITLIRFFDWMRGIFTIEPKMDDDVIMIPLFTQVDAMRYNIGKSIVRQKKKRRE